MAEPTIDQTMQLANALHHLGRVTDAERLYRQVLSRQPAHAGALNMLGVIGGDVGQFDQGIDLITRAIAIRPDVAEFHNNLGEMNRRKGQVNRAAAAYAEAIRLKPDYAAPHANLGLMLCFCGKPDEGIAQFREAIRLRPTYAKALNNLGNALKDCGQINEAIDSYRKAMAANPNDPSTFSNYLFSLYYDPKYDDRMILQEHLKWAEHFAKPLEAQILSHQNDRSPDRKLKIGYLSPDFCDHPAGRVILPLLANHDRKSFEVFCYANVAKPDEFTRLTQSYADHWRNILGVSDQNVVDQIRNDRIDILIDLAAHTAGNRLLVFARKPAPIQIVSFPGTTGLKTMDYRLTDPYFDPPGHERPYSEKSLFVRSFWCAQARQSPDVNAPPVAQSGYITFGCLNTFGKVSATTLDLWLKIMQAIPTARLLMKADAPSGIKAVREKFQAGSVQRDRIEFVGKKSLADYFNLYHRIDIGLDPTPFAGHTTTIDFLWMGVPLVTLAGQTCVGRGGVSILSTVGVTEFIARDVNQYIDIAVKLAGDLPLLAKYRSTLRQRMIDSPLMDAPGFARDIESGLRNAWRQWCSESGHVKLNR